jgi:putative transposase
MLRYAICENLMTAAENLNIKVLLKNNKPADSISDVSWSKFFDTPESWYCGTKERQSKYLPYSRLSNMF